MEGAGPSSAPLRRSVSAYELDDLESMESLGELPLMEGTPAAVHAPSPACSSPLLPLSFAPPALQPPPRPTRVPRPPPLLRQASKASRSFGRRRGRRALKGPLRAARLCLLAVLLPGLLVAGPLYLRFHVYADQVYPLAMSDMRLLDGRVSTTWCQRQVVRANATFNAFLLPHQPSVAPEPQRVSMVRELRLQDDMKEYWAFYLLRGSSITVSACVSHPGASLIVIRGHKHLHDCAYIGDNSSEEEDEADETEAWAVEEAGTLDEKKGGNSKESAEPAVLRRARPGVELPGAHAPLGSEELLDHAHPHDHDHEDGPPRHILHKVAQKRFWAGPRRGGSEEAQNSLAADALKPSSPAPEASSRPGSAPSSSEVFEEVLRKLRALGHRGNAVLRRLNHQLDRAFDASQAAAAAATAATAVAAATAAPPEQPSPAPASSVEDSDTDDSLANALEQPGAMEALRELVRRLLSEHAAETAAKEGAKEGNMQVTKKSAKQGAKESKEGLEGPRLVPEHDAEELAQGARRRRAHRHSPEVRLAAQRWNADEESDNVALEVDLQPDGIADHHMRMNETEAGDLDSSNSEFWSSFSSSEEALLKCTGLVLNLPLHPHHQCTPNAPPALQHPAASRNTLFYRVPTNGYYFFVFNSENEVETNYIRSHFYLERVVYNVSSPVASCHNTTQPCALPLDFFSSEKLVLEMPVRPNASLWNEEFVVISSCEPRTALYVACIVAVPLLIVIFAFQ